ncbi:MULTISPECIES: GTP pyrophosphokinase [unclassified Adlercreutzia]|uniref:GTP pyrophosphokinase n=1 Tax=unclassified Adlercreutzia TaxID=2636013 RepID=UPI00197CEE2C|nr:MULTISPECIES: GTP pyrophosphokinase family protein [unclassified Adlercreutzia]
MAQEQTSDGETPENNTATETGAAETTQNFFTRGISNILTRISNAQERHEALAKIRAGHREALTEQLVAQVAGNEEFAAMVERNIAPYQRLMSYYRCAMMEAETKFRVLNEEFGLQHDRNPIESIKSRLKSPDSLARKLYVKGYPMTMESLEKNINDIAGVRVVCTFLEDMYALAEALLAQDDVVLIERKDYIADPKASGYRSLHLIIEIPIFLEHEKRSVKVEVQLRTIAQNFWATLEHQLRYKKNLSEEATAYVAQELTDLAEAASSLDIRMQALRNYLDDDRNEK